MAIEVRNITKQFGTYQVLRDISFTVATGELVALVGPSGSGKTTLLRIIAGLEYPDNHGDIFFDGQPVAQQRIGQRRVGFVFQHYALFRHMNVYENIAFGLRVRPSQFRPTRRQIESRVHELLALIQLEGLAQRYPSQLSGGQRQRVALARALAVEPKILLLDEPFGALDAKVRQELRQWLRRFHDRIHLTSIFVTHDHEEALELADRIVVMNNGRIEQIGAPEEVFHNPASEFVMNFLGNVNLFHGRIEEGRAYIGPQSAQAESSAASQSVRVFVRPHELDVNLEPREHSSFTATVRRINAAGPQVKLELINENGEQFLAEISHARRKELNLEVGRQVQVHPREYRVFLEKPPSAAAEPIFDYEI